MNILNQVPADQIEGSKMADRIFIRVQDAVNLLWGDNPKEHDLGGIIQSIQEHGFQEIPVFDGTLPGIKAGNGRTYTLSVMEKEGMECPKGIGKLKDTGEWVMPLLVGTDADTVAKAIAYAIDSNNLTMAGGDFDGFDFSRMWNPDKYLAVLSGLSEEDMPVTVSMDDLNDLSRIYASVSSLSEFEGEDDKPPDPRDFWPIVRLQLEPAVRDRFTRFLDAFGGEDDNERVKAMLDDIGGE